MKKDYDKAPGKNFSKAAKRKLKANMSTERKPGSGNIISEMAKPSNSALIMPTVNLTESGNGITNRVM